MTAGPAPSAADPAIAAAGRVRAAAAAIEQAARDERLDGPVKDLSRAFAEAVRALAELTAGHMGCVEDATERIATKLHDAVLQVLQGLEGTIVDRSHEAISRVPVAWWRRTIIVSAAAIVCSAVLAGAAGFYVGRGSVDPTATICRLGKVESDATTHFRYCWASVWLDTHGSVKPPP